MTNRIYDRAISMVGAHPWLDDWAMTIRACVRRGQGNFCSLWETLGPEIGLSDIETMNRGVALYYWFCTLNLVDDIMDGDCDYVSKRNQPLAVLGMCTQVQRALAWTRVGLGTQVRANDRMGMCIDGQHREAKGCDSLTEYMEIGDAIAGAQFEAYFIVFADGTTFADAGACGQMYGRAAHVLKDIRDQDPRLLKCGDVPGAIAWALAGLDSAEVLKPPPSVAKRIETVRTLLNENEAQHG